MAEENKCSHPADQSAFLFHHLTPNVDDTVNLSVACCVFQCRACGSLYQRFLVVSRGYASDGTIPEDFAKSLVKIKENKEIEAALNERVNSEVARILTQRKQEDARSKSESGTVGKVKSFKPGIPGQATGSVQPPEHS